MELFKQWHDAMQEEIDALWSKQVWHIVDKPKDRTPIKYRWVYAVKSDGRKRARLVAKGFSQVFGLDYEGTFSLII